LSCGLQRSPAEENH
jgi:hypothetical protein